MIAWNRLREATPKGEGPIVLLFNDIYLGTVAFNNEYI